MKAQQPMPVTLYDFPFSGNGYKVRLALSQLGMVVEHRYVDLLKGHTRTANFLRINPAGQIPVLELADGTCLVESNAILCWLTGGTHLFPSDPMTEAEMLRWMFFEQSNIDRVLGRLRFLNTYPEFKERLPGGGYLEMLRSIGNDALALLNSHLKGQAFMVGDRYTAADICLYAYVHCAGEGGFDLESYSHVSAWCSRVACEPGYVPILTELSESP